MNIKEFITNFKGVKNTGPNEYVALCPAHDDHNPSLSIGFSKEKNHILLHCHAGCEAEDILSSIGLSLKDLYEEKKGSNIMNKSTYNYYKADGTLAYTKTRTDYTDGSKKFFFTQPDGTKGVKGVQRELYNLPAVLAAEKVYFVEGEKCAEAVIKQGAVATTLDTGAKSPWCSHYSEYLKNKEVIIIPDNDTPGMNYAKKVLQNVPAARIVKLPDLAEKGDIYDWLTVGHTMAELDELPSFEIGEDATAATGEHSESGQTEEVKAETQAETILRLVEEKGAFPFHDTINNPYIALTIDEHREVWDIDSEKFSLWLEHLYFSAKKKSVKRDSVSQAKDELKAKALFENKEAILLDTRAAEFDNAIWYNLSNDNWEAIKVTENGWELDTNPPILFKRYSHQICQYQPSKEGDIRRVLKYINLQENHTLFLCWLVSCFVPNIPHAMPIFFGEKGAAKTTACTLLKKLIDPSSLETLTFPRDYKSLILNFQEHWFLPFDNVSGISLELSDTLCRAITGGGIQQRKLYTNADCCIFKFKKCLALNGINNVANRPDLLDRAILIELCRIDESNRREMSELLVEFEKDQPHILGGVFDTLAKAMSIYPTVKLDKLPRMADFARWGYAIGEALGGLGDEFLDEYNYNQGKRNIEVLNSDITAVLLIAFMKNKPEWTSRVSELYKHLTELAPQYGISLKAAGFPGAPNALSRKLNEIASNLKEVGITFRTWDMEDGKHILIKNKNISPVSSANNYLINIKDVLNTNLSAPIFTPQEEVYDDDNEDVVF